MPRSPVPTGPDAVLPLGPSQQGCLANNGGRLLCFSLPVVVCGDDIACTHAALFIRHVKRLVLLFGGYMGDAPSLNSKLFVQCYIS